MQSQSPSPMQREFTIEYDGNSIYGRISFPDGSGPWPLVIFSHGFGASHVYESGMDRAFVERSLAFAAFDFCGGGPESRSSGTMLDMSVLTEARDLNAVVDWARSDERVDERRIFLLGSSQGGYVSTYVAGERQQDIAALALFFPAFNIGADAQIRSARHGGELPERLQIGPHVVGRRYNDDAISVDIFDHIARFSGDVLIVHGAKDEIVPIEYSRRAVQAFGGTCKLEVIEELGHGFRAYPPALHERAIGMALDFFAAH